jgi:hypothetical protein
VVDDIVSINKDGKVYVNGEQFVVLNIDESRLLSTTNIYRSRK